MKSLVDNMTSIAEAYAAAKAAEWQAWDQYFLRIAEVVSTRSKDPSTKVGCVIVNRNKIIQATGYNGFPMRVKDLPERYANRELKYKMVVHSEPNAIVLAKKDFTNCVIYTIPMPPCSTCAGIIIQAGIRRVVSYGDDVENPRWGDSFKIAKTMYDEAGVKLTLLSKSTGA